MKYKSYESLLKHYEEILKEEKVKKTQRESIVKEHIEYICQRAKKRKLNIADVWLSKLQDGIDMTVEEVEQYAKDNKYIICGKTYNGENVSCVRIYVGKVL